MEFTGKKLVGFGRIGCGLEWWSRRSGVLEWWSDGDGYGSWFLVQGSGFGEGGVKTVKTVKTVKMWDRFTAVTLLV